MLRAPDPSSCRTAQALCVLISLTILTAANSQEITSQPAIDDDTFIDEVIVSAQKRERSAQDVPISMSVFTGGDLEALNLTNVAQVSRYTPNLEWDQSFFGASNSSSIFIRGIGQGANFAEHSSDPGVGVYLDGEDRWHGPMKLGEERTLSATFAVVTRGNYTVSAVGDSFDPSIHPFAAYHVTLPLRFHTTIKHWLTSGSWPYT